MTQEVFEFLIPTTPLKRGPRTAIYLLPLIWTPNDQLVDGQPQMLTMT
jgi:hypothetical protein